ncbi:MAG: hypothetical protein HUJ60_01305, partial [Bacilli bacterium]|nr:hypothetical protein [Bacilli bacterium]
SEPGKALVLAHDILDAQEFYHEEHAGTREVTGVDPVTGEAWSTSGIYPNNYQYSDLRRYANTDFFNTAFTEDQKTDVAVSLIDNSAATTEYHTNDYACSNTQDRIFPLSHREACNADYGFVDDSGRTTTREKRATDYAKCLGILVNANGNSNWWTRSPSCSYADYVSECDYSGYLQGNRVVSCGVGLLPAARFYLG